MSLGTRRTPARIAPSVTSASGTSVARQLRTRTPAQPPISLTGAASTALKPALESPRRTARVLAVFPLGVYLEARGNLEPRVIALVTGEATRLPNAVVLGATLPKFSVGDEAAVGDGGIEVGNVVIRVRRWWDPTPALGDLDPSQLDQALTRMAAIRGASTRATGLDTNGFPQQLAEGCAAGSLLETITATEQLMGLGPGLTPSGDDMLAGLLVALRHLGRAAGATRAVWLADWLAATVVFDARTRTTPISATLLYCAAKGEACAEALSVLRAIAGRQPMEPAMQRLMRLGHTSGADLTWGIQAGLAAVISLSTKPSHNPSHNASLSVGVDEREAVKSA